MRLGFRVHEHEGRSKSSRSPLEDRPAVPDKRTDRLQALRSRKECVEPRIPVVFFVGRVISGDDVQNVVLDAFSYLAATVDAHQAGFQEPTSTGEIIPDRHLFGLEHRLELGGSRRRDSEHNLRRLRLGPILRTCRVLDALSIATTAARVPLPTRFSFHLAPGQCTLRSPRHAGASDRHYLIRAQSAHPARLMELPGPSRLRQGLPAATTGPRFLPFCTTLPDSAGRAARPRGGRRKPGRGPAGRDARPRSSGGKSLPRTNIPTCGGRSRSLRGGPRPRAARGCARTDLPRARLRPEAGSRHEPRGRRATTLPEQAM